MWAAGIIRPEDGHRGQTLTGRDGPYVRHGGARARVEEVEGDAVDAKGADGLGELDPLVRCLAHAEDSAGADLVTEVASGPDGLELLVVGVGRAHPVEEAARRLEVVVIVQEPGSLQPRELGPAHEAEGGAGLDPRLLPDEPHRLLDGSELLLLRDARSRGDDGELTGARLLGRLGLLGDVAGAEQRILGRGRPGEVSRLRAEAAILGTVATLGVDDSAQCHRMTVDGPADGPGAGEERLERFARGVLDEAARLFAADGFDARGSSTDMAPRVTGPPRLVNP